MNLAELIESPQEHDIFEAIYLLEKTNEAWFQSNNASDSIQVGHDGPFAREVVRFKSDPGLGFNGIAINKITTKQKDTQAPASWELSIACMGLVGSGGVLPQHYTEMVQQRIKARDYALLDFIDMFNHRIISLYYRAWQKYRIALHHGSSLSKGKNDTFSACVDSLSGNHLSNPMINYYAAYFQSGVRSAAKLQSMLTDFIGVKVEVKQFIGQWLSVDRDEQSRFDKKNKHLACLGEGLLLGQKFRSVQNAISIKIGPLDYSTYLDLLPGRTLNRALKTLVNEYVEPGITIDLSLLMQEFDKRVTQLDKNTRLGESSWLGCGDSMDREILNKFVSFAV